MLHDMAVIEFNTSPRCVQEWNIHDGKIVEMRKEFVSHVPIWAVTRRAVEGCPGA